ncbi:hypothetical protein HNY73_022788 [Argiope bruennichi]|uniref:Uncharacterized protein n=1 Tax=Argiope bruennichi TaxID=94029 RepID=A0A8T0E3A3_ARGBR|nr:hypothetical protein HNY73_022788 [Argiope bruennichi]
MNKDTRGVRWVGDNTSPNKQGRDTMAGRVGVTPGTLMRVVNWRNYSLVRKALGYCRLTVPSVWHTHKVRVTYASIWPYSALSRLPSDVSSLIKYVGTQAYSHRARGTVEIVTAAGGAGGYGHGVNAGAATAAGAKAGGAGEVTPYALLLKLFVYRCSWMVGNDIVNFSDWENVRDGAPGYGISTVLRE